MTTNEPDDRARRVSWIEVEFNNRWWRQNPEWPGEVMVRYRAWRYWLVGARVELGWLVITRHEDPVEGNGPADDRWFMWGIDFLPLGWEHEEGSGHAG